MIRSEPARAAVATMGITIYGCEPDEAILFDELAPELGVVPTITASAVCEANVDLAFGNACISVGHKTEITDATLRALREAGVTYVSTRSIGFNHVDVAYARSLGIQVEGVAYSPDSVADYTLMLILMLLRDARGVLRRADRHDYRLGAARGLELRDRTVGVVGAGRIGRAVIDRLRGFGCCVLTHDLASAGHIPLDELLERSDVVTLHAPLTAATRHLLDARRLARLPAGALVVNTGRGALLDTAALVAALEDGRLGGAALDVLEGEDGIFYADWRDRPLEHDLLLRLHRLPNVLISPHTAYYTDHALRDTVQNSLANCLGFAGGRA